MIKLFLNFCNFLNDRIVPQQYILEYMPNNNLEETATLAGGCFWCTEAIFKRLKGITSVFPGYAGGMADHPTYEQVCSGNTGHAEAVQIKFDPNIIPFEKILDIFWNTHNPTTLNQQGNDIGTQYRSVIFFHNPKQQQIAENSKAKIQAQKLFTSPLVTEIIPFTNFFAAEDYHQNYFDRNSQAPYCNIVISPKIHKLLEKYSRDVKEEYKSVPDIVKIG